MQSLQIPFSASYIAIQNPTQATVYFAPGQLGSQPPGAISISATKSFTGQMQTTRSVTIFWSSSSPIAQTDANEVVVSFSDQPITMQVSDNGIVIVQGNVTVSNPLTVQFANAQQVEITNTPTVQFSTAQQVEVMNTATVEFASAQQVAIANTPTVQFAAGQEVNINTGTVTVNNPTTAPVYVNAVAHEPISSLLDVLVPGGAGSSQTVPLWRSTQVQQVSRIKVIVTGVGSGQPFEVGLWIGESLIDYAVIPTGGPNIGVLFDDDLSPGVAIPSGSDPGGSIYLKVTNWTSGTFSCQVTAIT